MGKCVICLIISILVLMISVLAQKRSNNNKPTTFVNNGKGQQNNNTGAGTLNVKNSFTKTIKHETYNYIYEKNKERTLRVDKYIDVNRTIHFYIGGNDYTCSKERLIKGIYPFHDFFSFDEWVDTISLKLKIADNRLFISSKCFPFDEKPFTISSVIGLSNNKINQGYEQYASEQMYEVRDNHGIPLFQLYLDKKRNAIIFNGVFFFDKKCVILGSEGMEPIYFEDVMNMDEKRKAQVLRQCKEKVQRYMKPIDMTDSLNWPKKLAHPLSPEKLDSILRTKPGQISLVNPSKIRRTKIEFNTRTSGHTKSKTAKSILLPSSMYLDRVDSVRLFFIDRMIFASTQMPIQYRFAPGPISSIDISRKLTDTITIPIQIIKGRVLINMFLRNRRGQPIALLRNDSIIPITSPRRNIDSEEYDFVFTENNMVIYDIYGHVLLGIHKAMSDLGICLQLTGQFWLDKNEGIAFIGNGNTLFQ